MTNLFIYENALILSLATLATLALTVLLLVFSLSRKATPAVSPKVIVEEAPNTNIDLDQSSTTNSTTPSSPNLDQKSQDKAKKPTHGGNSTDLIPNIPYNPSLGITLSASRSLRQSGRRTGASIASVSRALNNGTSVRGWFYKRV